jgi:hypothetical protein
MLCLNSRESYVTGTELHVLQQQEGLVEGSTAYAFVKWGGPKATCALGPWLPLQGEHRVTFFEAERLETLHAFTGLGAVRKQNKAATQRTTSQFCFTDLGTSSFSCCCQACHTLSVVPFLVFG